MAGQGILRHETVGVFSEFRARGVLAMNSSWSLPEPGLRFARNAGRIQPLPVGGCLGGLSLGRKAGYDAVPQALSETMAVTDGCKS